MINISTYRNYVPFSFLGEKPPPDRTEIEPFLRVVTYSLFVSVCALAALGIIFGIVCLCFNIVNKHRRYGINSNAFSSFRTCAYYNKLLKVLFQKNVYITGSLNMSHTTDFVQHF